MAIDNSFCTHCGAVIPEGSKFCPDCGTSIDGSENPYAYESHQSTPGGLDSTRILILIYGVIATIFGLLAVLGSMMLTSEMWEQAMEMYGTTFDMDLDALKMSALIEGIIIIASGICAILSSYCIKNGNVFPAAMILCLIASALSLVLFPLGIITLAVGLYMTYRIYSFRGAY
jgi:hypothetical protein